MVLFPGTKSPARGEKDVWACLGPDKSAGSLPQSGMAHQLIHRYHCLCFALLTMGSSLHIHPFLVWTHQLKQYNTEFMTAKNTICKYNDFRISGEPWLLLGRARGRMCTVLRVLSDRQETMLWPWTAWTLLSHTFLSSVCLKGTEQREGNPLFYMQATRKTCKHWACGPSLRLPPGDADRSSLLHGFKNPLWAHWWAGGGGSVGKGASYRSLVIQVPSLEPT